VRLELICQETCCRRVGNMPEIMAALRPSTNPSAEPMECRKTDQFTSGASRNVPIAAAPPVPLTIIKNEVGFQLSRTVVHEQA